MALSHAHHEALCAPGVVTRAAWDAGAAFRRSLPAVEHLILHGRCDWPTRSDNHWSAIDVGSQTYFGQNRLPDGSWEFDLRRRDGRWRWPTDYLQHLQRHRRLPTPAFERFILAATPRTA